MQKKFDHSLMSFGYPHTLAGLQVLNLYEAVEGGVANSPIGESSTILLAWMRNPLKAVAPPVSVGRRVTTLRKMYMYPQ